MTVMAPKDEAELRDMMLTAIKHEAGPIALRYPRGNGVGVDCSRAPQEIEIGRAELLRLAHGRHALLIGFGHTVQFCMEAAEILSRSHGIECSVINARFAKPLDEQLLGEMISEHPLVMTVEDHAIQGGFGSAVLEFMADNGLTAGSSLVRLGIDDFFVEHGTQAELQKICKFDVDAIVDRVYSEVRTSSSPRLSLLREVHAR